MTAYYNENDKAAAAWLRELIAGSMIALGDVDERDIAEVQPNDLRRYSQCHFFAGIGGWSYALRLAGWPDDRPVWTGSCPCQPFSAAGQRRGISDERHLWPAWFRLIRECRPAIIFGEQVASSEVVGNEGEGSRIPTYLSEAEPRSRFGEAREISRSQTRCRLRPFEIPAGITAEDRRWGLRDERPAVQLGWWQDMGQPVARQDQTGDRLHLLKCPDCYPCAQQRNGRLGRCEDVGDRPRNPEQAARSLQRALGTARAEFDEIAGDGWLDGVRVDLESAGYALGASVLPAAGVGAPHIRQRLYWVADSIGERHARLQLSGCQRLDYREYEQRKQPRSEFGEQVGWLADADGWVASDRNLQRSRQHGQQPQDGGDGGVGDTDGSGYSFGTRLAGNDGTQVREAGRKAAIETSFIRCLDGKSRRVEPGIFPLVDGLPRGVVPSGDPGSPEYANATAEARTMRLRGYGNAIVPQVAAEFIRCASEADTAALKHQK